MTQSAKIPLLNPIKTNSSCKITLKECSEILKQNTNYGLDSNVTILINDLTHTVISYKHLIRIRGVTEEDGDDRGNHTGYQHGGVGA